MGAVLASAQQWDRVTKAKGSDTLELGVSKMEGAAFFGRPVDGTIANATRGQESGLLVLRKIVSNCLGLKVI